MESVAFVAPGWRTGDNAPHVTSFRISAVSLARVMSLKISWHAAKHRSITLCTHQPYSSRNTCVLSVKETLPSEAPIARQRAST
jgi:hypothetical protein